MNGFSGAGCHTGWLSAYLYTEIALLHGAVMTKLRYTKWAGIEAFLAAVAFIPINHNDAILSPLGNGISWAYFHASRLSTVHTGQGEKGSGDIGKLATPGLNDSPPF